MCNLTEMNINFASIIMGCWQIGGLPHWPHMDERNSTKLIFSALDSGISAFDTAPGYGNGYSERQLGINLKSCRHNVFIATKVFADKLSYSKVIESCNNSLINLQTDYIDLFQVHFPSGSFGSPIVPIEETMGAFLHLKNEGKIRAIGVSNFSLIQLKEACKYVKIASIQIPYSLFWRNSADDVTSYCKEHNIYILAYSPLAQGILTGKFYRNYTFSRDEIRSKLILCEPEHYAKVQDALDELRPIAKDNNMSLAELSLKWIISQSNTLAVVGASKPEQVYHHKNLQHLYLSKDIFDKIDFIGRSVAKHFDKYSYMWRF